VLLKLWAGIGAVVCGVGMASLSGGSTPHALGLILVAALLVGVGATAVVVANNRIDRRAGHAAWAEENVRTVQNDRAGAKRLSDLIGRREIDWLRRESFEHPWRDDRVAPFRALAVFDINENGVVDPQLEIAVARLVSSTESFLREYDAQTIPDPIVPGGTWRMVGSRGEEAAASDPTDNGRLASQNRLREAAARICERHADLTLLATHVFPPD
jgi:hypothetical protein